MGRRGTGGADHTTLQGRAASRYRGDDRRVDKASQAAAATQRSIEEKQRLLLKESDPRAKRGSKAISTASKNSFPENSRWVGAGTPLPRAPARGRTSSSNGSSSARRARLPRRILARQPIPGPLDRARAPTVREPPPAHARPPLERRLSLRTLEPEIDPRVHQRPDLGLAPSNPPLPHPMVPPVVLPPRSQQVPPNRARPQSQTLHAQTTPRKSQRRKRRKHRVNCSRKV